MRIRSKLVSIVVVALLVPLLIGIFYVHSFGRLYYQKQQGMLYLTIAEELADSLRDGVVREFRHVENWLSTGDPAGRIMETAVPPGAVDRQLDSRWATLSESEEPLASILSGPLAKHLLLIQQINPGYSEVLLTDRYGRLLAATQHTTDYLQGDEGWWKAVAEMQPDSGIVCGLIFDESASLPVIDMAFPLYRGKEEREFVGTMKVSLHATYLLQESAPHPWNKDILRDVLYPDGRLFTRISMEAEPDQPVAASMEALRSLLSSPEGWGTAELYGDRRSMAAVVPISLSVRDMPPMLDSGGTRELYVVVHRNLSEVMAPVHEVMRHLIACGIVLSLFFALICYLMASYWFARPLRRLSRVAQSISEHIQQSELGNLDEARASRHAATGLLKDLKKVKSRDELQVLAEDVLRMGGRMLTFHTQLERELTEKSEEIHSDLIMAREFQEALLPQNYPEMEASVGDRYRLNFSHVYRPALSVSGDFFDIAKVSDHCVRVFIADVMGHGARSALMTAILHALLHSVEKDTQNPASLLQRMNDEFYSLGQKTEEMLFVTAFHLVIDTRQGTIRYASAGHPAPLTVDHASGDVTFLPLTDEQPAAGLLENAVYRNHEILIKDEQTLLLYTDGATEALNRRNEEFGDERLINAVAGAHASSELAHLPKYILENLETFMDTVPTLDDICLISVDITRA